MRVLLRDINVEVVEGWRNQLGSAADISITHGDIFDLSADAIVSPANSFGFMDGGIDLVYSRYFGWDLQDRLQQKIRDEHAGEVPVGVAVIVPTGNANIPWLICAPTMRVPEDVSASVNAYLAFRAALLVVIRHNTSSHSAIKTILCPGLATAVGRMPPRRCAYQMHAAWLSVTNPPPPPFSLGQVREGHYAMSAARR